MAKVAAGFIVFRRTTNENGIHEIQYLLLQSSRGRFHWSPPKGHLKTGETERQAAFRETEEEAGYSREKLTLFEAFREELNYKVRGKPKKVTYWLAELNNAADSVRLSDEHQVFEWLPLEEAKQRVQHNMKDALTRANEYVTRRLC